MILIALLSHRFQILSAFALSLIFILTNIHQPAYAQSEVQYDASLRTFGQTYEGNLCITVGGASLHTGDDASAPDAETSFTLDIQGTLIVAEAFWSGRDKGQGEDGPPVVAGTGDNTITVNNTSVAATASFFAKVDDRNSPVEVRRAFGYHADVTNLINSGLNTITVGGLNIREDHGVGIIAIYENTNSCPYVAINLSEGLDAVSKSKPAPAGPNGALHCSEFPAANVARTFDWATVVGGIAPWTPPGKTEEEPRPADIWFATGNGTPPTDIIDANPPIGQTVPDNRDPTDYQFPYPLGFTLGAGEKEFDIYQEGVVQN